jgi:hypothetical protein
VPRPALLALVAAVPVLVAAAVAAVRPPAVALVSPCPAPVLVVAAPVVPPATEAVVAPCARHAVARVVVVGAAKSSSR